MFHLRTFGLSVLLMAAPSTCLSDQTAGEAPAVRSARSRIEPYVNWLPATSETLIVSESPYVITAEQPEFESLPDDATLLDVQLTLLPLLEGDAREVLAGKRVKLWIEASSRFHYPEFPEQLRDVDPSIGVVLQYDGCHILVFDELTPADTTKLFEKLLLQHPEPTSHIPAASRHQITGHETIAWSAKPPDLNQHRLATPEQLKQLDAVLSIRYWIASPVDNVLAVATSADVLAEALRKVEDPDQAAFPSSLEEWNHIAGETPIWGMRHYFLPEPRPGDLSDLRDSAGNGLSGFTFEIDEHTKRARLTFLDCSSNTIYTVKSNVLAHISSEAEFTQEPDGTLVVHLDWSQESPDAARTITRRLASWLIIHLGHAFVI